MYERVNDAEQLFKEGFVCSQAAKDKGLFSTLCRKYVRDSAEIIEDLFKEDKGWRKYNWGK